jgi:hypothetical protein
MQGVVVLDPDGIGMADDLTKLRSRQKEYLVIVDAQPGKLQVKQAC